MKNKTDRRLLVTCLVSALACVIFCITYLEVYPYELWKLLPGWWKNLCGWMAYLFSAIPLFCLQMLLCRRAKKGWLKLLPLAALGLLIVSLLVGAATATGWDSLGYFILLCLTIAPAVGCAAGWIAWFISKKRGAV